MVEYKKNCPENAYSNKLRVEEPYEEFLYSQSYFKCAEELENKDYGLRPSLDNYFTAIQILSNAILLKKLSIRSKISACGYYKLYLKKIISKNLYEKIDSLREDRNIIHYYGNKAFDKSDDEIKELIKNIKVIFEELSKIYEK